MKKRMIVAGILAIAAVPLAFKLFEPVFTYELGWTALPADVPVTAPDVADARMARAAAAARTVLVAARQELDAPAMSVAVAIDGQLAWRAVAGYADLETRVAADYDTAFRIGSTSKAVTAVAVGVLIDNGKIDVDQPIQAYVQAYPEKRWPVTLKQVMSHRAGIRDYGFCLCFPIWEHLNRRHFDSIDAAVALVADAPLTFQPGTDFRYTSLGYNLTGAAIETASGQRFDRYLRNAVFTPLGMTRSSAETEAGAGTGFYETRNREYKRAFAVDNSIRQPSGGIVSTPTDMVRLGNALLDDRLLSSATRKLLVTVPATGGTSAGARMYALGWRNGDWHLFDGKVKTRAYHHAGAAVGSTSVLVVLPEHRMVISVMMNKGVESADGLFAAADHILEAFIKR